MGGHPDGSGDDRALGMLMRRSQHKGLPIRLEIRTPLARLGRAASNHLIIDDPSVAPVHAEFALRGGVWSVRDLEMDDRISVDGAVVSGTVALGPGSEVQIGDIVFAFDARDEWGDSPADDPLIDALPEQKAPVPVRIQATPTFTYPDFDRSTAPVLWIVGGVAILAVVAFLLLQGR